LCSQLFAEPQRLVKAHSFRAAPAESVARRARAGSLGAHAHPDLLQLDLALRCRGHWMVNGKKYEVRDDTLIVFYPQESHTYFVEESLTGARVLSIKIRVDSHCPVVRTRALEHYRPRAEHLEALICAWERLTWLFNAPLASQSESVTAQMLRLSEVLCLWPRSGAAAPPGLGTSNDEAVEAALRYLEAHLNRVVPLEELAQVSHISARHFVRRFQMACGQSPRAYAEARRLSTARDWLLRETHSISYVAHHLGFSSLHAFSRWFKAHNGASPREWQREAATRHPTSRVPFR
jgi:AraC-like DNA-binding protein